VTPFTGPDGKPIDELDETDGEPANPRWWLSGPAGSDPGDHECGREVPEPRQPTIGGAAV